MQLIFQYYLILISISIINHNVSQISQYIQIYVRNLGCQIDSWYIKFLLKDTSLQLLLIQLLVDMLVHYSLQHPKNKL